MAESTFSPNGYSFAAGKDIISAAITSVVNSDEHKAEMQSVLEPLGFKRAQAISPDQVVTGVTGPKAFGPQNENAPAPIASRNETYKKGIKIEQYPMMTEISKLFMKWLEKKGDLNGSDANTVAMRQDLMSSVKFLTDSAKLTLAYAATAVYAKGTSITAANGAGSASPDGKALFADDHVIKFPYPGGATSFDNKLATAFDATNLLAAINHYRLNVYDADGSRIKEPDAYTIILPRDLKSAFYTAVNAINMAGTPSSLAGTGSNASLVNPFFIGSQKVVPFFAEYLNQYGPDGAKLGSATGWYLLNREYALDTGAFQYHELWAPEVEMEKDFDSGKYKVKIDMGFSVDHFNPSAVILGNV